MIYLVKNAARNACKIGYSSDPRKRLSSLQTATIDQLELIGTLHGGRELERETHELFAGWHITGEWFTLVPEIVAHFEPVQEKLGDNERAVMLSKTAMQQIPSYPKQGAQYWPTLWKSCPTTVSESPSLLASAKRLVSFRKTAAFTMG